MVITIKFHSTQLGIKDGWVGNVQMLLNKVYKKIQK